MNFDVGPHLFSLGLLWLLFHYILPVVFALVFFLGVFLLFRYALGKVGNLDRNVSIVVVCLVLILILVLVR